MCDRETANVEKSQVIHYSIKNERKSSYPENDFDNFSSTSIKKQSVLLMNTFLKKKIMCDCHS